jgi:transposase-like protein
MKRQDHSDDVKAAAMAALLQGQSVASVAAEYELPVGTVKSWKARANRVQDASVASPKRAEEIGDLLVDYLAANLRALRVQADVFADASWLQRQKAEAVAVLHGVMTDKAVRLLEALSRAGLNPESPPE